MRKILVIEDELELRENIADMLHFEGYQVIQAPDGQTGFYLAQKEPPDIILCDIRMPHMNGYDLLEEFRKKENFPGIPFIYLTALTDKSDFRQAMELGADDFLTKPFTRKELTGAIEAQLEKYQSKEVYIQKKIREIETELSRKFDELKNDYESQRETAMKVEEENEWLSHQLNKKEIEATKESLKAIEVSNTIQSINKIISHELNSPEISAHQKKLFSQLRDKIKEKKFLFNNWTLFQFKFNQIYPQYISRLTNRYKNLTQYELIFISATRMGMNTIQISDLLNISADSVRKSRYRLKKKLGLNPDEDFMEFINSFGF